MGIVEIKGLTKDYEGVRAVDNLSLEIEKGEIFALLGPNGAGKTTTIKSMLGLIFPTAGEIKINGFDVLKEGKKAKENIGYLPERVAFYDNLTAIQTMEFYAELRGADRKECIELLMDVGLDGEMDKKVGNYSKGMMQRLGLAQAMIGNPSLLILDEPTGGLDPRGSWQIRQKIKELNENGTTIFLSSHILSEVQEVSSRVAILNHGKLIEVDTLDNLGKKLDLQPTLVIELQRPSQSILSRVKQVKGVDSAELSGNVIKVRCNPRVKTNIINAIENEGGKILDFRTVEPSLEEVFLKFTEGD
ncbi:MAG: ABC transporter ATP-binding protein [Thermoplasmata archaeon]|nr:ABC transporter ATP-binding protein [Thermoplasmata archaeon]RLF64222.1 MAG: ABC transporter ATP-binding protein [Thermoplasmata archaeon]